MTRGPPRAALFFVRVARSEGGEGECPHGHFGDRLLEAVESKRSHVVVGLDPEYGSLPPEVLAAHPAGPVFASEAEMKAACYSRLPGGAAARGRRRGLRRQDPDRLLRGSGRARLRPVRGDGEAGPEPRPARHRRRQAGRHREHGRGLRPGASRRRRGGRGDGEPVLRHRRAGAVLQALPGSRQGRLRPGEDLQPEFGRDPGRAPGLGRAGLRPRGRSRAGSGAGTRSAAGATAPSARWSEARIPSREPLLRKRLAGVPFLIPGYGAQGATARDLAALFDANGTGAVVNSARAILYAYRKAPGRHWVDAARDEAAAMRAALWKAAGRA